MENGEVIRCRLCTRWCAVVLDPEHNQSFSGETDRPLSMREGYPSFPRMLGGDFFFAPYHEYLRQREAAVPRFKSDAMRLYVALMVDETENLIARLGHAGEFDPIPEVGPLVMNIAAHAFLGRDFQRSLDDDDFFSRFRDFSRGVDVMWPPRLPLPHLRRSRRARRKLDRVFGAWIHHRRKHAVDPPDFFQNLINAIFADRKPISGELIVNLTLMLIWAGHETTAGQLAWTLIDLLQYPDYLDEVRDEVDAMPGNRRLADIGSPETGALVEAACAVKESERLHPVAHMAIRRAIGDVRFGQGLVPRGEHVLAAPCVPHLMPEVFRNPLAYQPRRFERGGAATGPEVNRLIGFGGGVHRCIGVNFARLEAKVVLALLARHYDMELLDPPRPAGGTVTRWPTQPARVRSAARAAACGQPAPEADAVVSAEVATGGCPCPRCSVTMFSLMVPCSSSHPTAFATRSPSPDVRPLIQFSVAPPIRAPGTGSFAIRSS